MSVNRERPHLYVIPEDDRDRELANGFIGNLWVNDRQAKVMPVAGGWFSVLEKFKAEYIPYLRTYDQGYVVLLIDFDEDYDSRFSQFADQIPKEIKDRV